MTAQLRITQSARSKIRDTLWKNCAEIAPEPDLALKKDLR